MLRALYECRRNAKTVDTGYLDRVANVNGQLVILLDVEKLLTQSAKVLRNSQKI